MQNIDISRLKKQRATGYALIVLLVAIYMLHSYKSARLPPYHIVSEISEINPFFFLPFVGIIALLYGLWSKDKWLAFLVGFLPLFCGGIIFIVLTSHTFTSLLQGLLFMPHLPLAFSCGLMGYGGGMRKKEDRDWMIVVLVGVLLWILMILF